MRNPIIFAACLFCLLISAGSLAGNQGLNYDSANEAVLDITNNYIRGPWVFNNGFRYEFHNGGGGNPEVIFEIQPYAPYLHKQGYEADLYKYKGLLYVQISELYHAGFKTADEILKRLKKDTYKGDSDSCPKISVYYDGLFHAMKDKAASVSQTGKNVIYTDSPDVFHYYFSNGTDGLQLDLVEENGQLYKQTHEAMSYLERCGTLMPAEQTQNSQ